MQCGCFFPSGHVAPSRVEACRQRPGADSSEPVRLRVQGKRASSRLGARRSQALGCGASQLARTRVARPPLAAGAPSITALMDFIEGVLGTEADIKESSRSFRRTVYDFENWKDHRSSTRYVKDLRSIPSSRLVRGLLTPALGAVSSAVAVASYNTAAELGLLPIPDAHVFVMTATPFQLTASALALLLVFRTNSSYSRWLDARRVWGAVLNRARDLGRQTMAWFDPRSPELRAQMLRYVAAFPHALRMHLREGDDVEVTMRTLLTGPEVDALLLSKHRPNHVMQMITTVTAHAGLTPMQQSMVDANVTSFEDDVGMCERILKTPIPLSYTRHTARFLMLYLLFLPFGLWDQCKWMMVPAVLLISVGLLGIEDIGVQIEEPFSILPLDRICATAEADLKEIASGQGACEALVAPRAPPRRVGSPTGLPAGNGRGSAHAHAGGEASASPDAAPHPASIY